MMTKMERIIEALMHIRCNAASTEAQLHEQTKNAFVRAGIEACHEVKLGPGARIDFVACGIGIEIKKKRPERARLIAQLERYAEHEEIEGLIVVSPCGIDLPKRIRGKQIKAIALERLWGIGLP